MEGGRKKEHKVSIWWKLLLLVLLIQLPFCGLFTYSAARTVKSFNDQMAQSQIGSLQVFREALQKQIQNAGSFLYTECWSSKAFAEAGETDGLAQAQQAIAPVLEAAEDFLANNTDMSGIVFYLPGLDGGWSLDERGLEDNTELVELLQSVAEQSGIENLGWYRMTMGEDLLLVRVCGDENCYSMAYMNLNDLTTGALSNYRLPGSVVLRDGNTLLTRAAWSRSLSGQLTGRDTQPDSWYFIQDSQGKGRYQITEVHFAGMTLCMGVPYIYDWTWMYLLIFSLVGVVLFTFLLGMMYLRRAFFLPLRSLTQTMHNIQAGSRPSREFEYSSHEFAAIHASFNEMVDALEHQRIVSYETELRARRSEVQALRLQIRRHFFLNCLKNIYAMANTGDLENIKAMTLLLSTNLRYTLDLHRETVELKTELEMCRTYIRLQGVGQEEPPALTVQMEPGLEKIQIPPVSILTLLENCCKYGQRQDGPLKITVSAFRRSLDSAQYLCIAVQDNGLGFPPDMLQKLNNDLEQMLGEGHVGCANTMMRLRMLYGAECEALFRNCGGARVEWIIPWDKEKQEMKANETADRG